MPGSRRCLLWTDGLPTRCFWRSLRTRVWERRSYCKQDQPWTTIESGTGAHAKDAKTTARQSRNRNGRGEPRNTRNTRKEGGETLSFLFRVFRVFSGSVRLWRILAAREQFGLLQCK